MHNNCFLVNKSLLFDNFADMKIKLDQEERKDFLNYLENIYQNEERDEALNDLLTLDGKVFKGNVSGNPSLDEALASTCFSLYEDPLDKEADIAFYYDEYLPFLAKQRTLYETSFLSSLPYFRLLNGLENKKKGTISFEKVTYEPYQIFLSDDRVKEEGLSSFTPIGAFRERVSYPAIKKKGRIWMSLIPHEINTMAKPFSAFKGHVLLYGLGIGYAAYEASEKSDVTKVTIVDNDHNVIALFKELMLPLFPHKEKIEIIEGDALEFASKTKNKQTYEVLFADLWHDGMDGLPLYASLIRNEGNTKRNFYWVENDILEYYSRLYIRYLLSIFEDDRDFRMAANDYGSEVASIFISLSESDKNKTLSSIKAIMDEYKIESLRKNIASSVALNLP